MSVADRPVILGLVTDALDETGGEMTPAIAGQLEELELSPVMCDGVIDMIKFAEAQEAEAKANAAPYVAAQRAAALKAQTMKDWLQARMEKAGVDHLRGRLHSCRIQDSPGPVIRWPGSPETIPLPFQRTKIDVDPNAAKLAHRRGELPEGFVVEHGRHLRIVG